MDQAAPEKAVEMHSIVHSTRLRGEVKTRGTCTSRTPTAIMRRPKSNSRRAVICLFLCKTHASTRR
jgi:hypothetical protein